MRNQYTAFLLLIFLIAPMVLKAQNYVLINGQVFNLKGESLVGAHALNSTRGYGTFTDQHGKFFLVLAEKDSLKVSMIGFKPYTMQIPQGLTAQSYNLKVTLVSDTLILVETTIRPYPATYREFKHEFLSLRTPEEIALKKLHLPSQPYRRSYESPEGGLLMPGPFTLLYNTFSKEAKELRKVKSIRERDNLREHLLKIVSRDVLKLRYGCISDDDIDSLIASCGISKEYLSATPHYVIARRISVCGNYWKNNPH